MLLIKSESSKFDPQKVRLKEDIKRLKSLSSIDARRLYFLMIEYMFFSDDDFAEEEIEVCKEYAKLLRLKEAQEIIEKAQSQCYQESSKKLFEIFAKLREKFVHISPIEGKSFE